MKKSELNLCDVCQEQTILLISVDGNMLCIDCAEKHPDGPKNIDKIKKVTLREVQ